MRELRLVIPWGNGLFLNNYPSTFFRAPRIFYLSYRLAFQYISKSHDLNSWWFFLLADPFPLTPHDLA